MKIKKLGEFGLIELIKKMALPCRGVIKGIGDDCAVLPFNQKKFLLFTCDMLVEDVDFTYQDKPYLVGQKGLGVCLSDIAACGGLPRYAQISLGLPVNMPVSRIKELYRGIVSRAGEFKVDIVGGDISRCDKLVIDVNLLGLVERRNLILRQGAKKGDIIFVSGKLGGSIYGRHLTFVPRIKESRYLVRNYRINSMIDISDGLLQDLGHILKQSNKGAVLFKDLIPLSADAHNFQEALSMGEDFELLFTLSPSEARKFLRISKNKRFIQIGEITDKAKGLVLLDRQGKRLKAKSGGYKHF
ncbi:MAG: thiamine-phosphate kinase [Candidatus Omnitrophota bacterium]